GSTGCKAILSWGSSKSKSETSMRFYKQVRIATSSATHVAGSKDACRSGPRAAHRPGTVPDDPECAAVGRRFFAFASLEQPELCDLVRHGLVHGIDEEYVVVRERLPDRDRIARPVLHVTGPDLLTGRNGHAGDRGDVHRPQQQLDAGDTV